MISLLGRVPLDVPLLLTALRLSVVERPHDLVLVADLEGVELILILVLVFPDSLEDDDWLGNVQDAVVEAADRARRVVDLKLLPKDQLLLVFSL